MSLIFADSGTVCNTLTATTEIENILLFLRTVFLLSLSNEPEAQQIRAVSDNVPVSSLEVLKDV